MQLENVSDQRTMAIVLHEFGEKTALQQRIGEITERARQMINAESQQAAIRGHEDNTALVEAREPRTGLWFGGNDERRLQPRLRTSF